MFSLLVSFRLVGPALVRTKRSVHVHRRTGWQFDIAACSFRESILICHADFPSLLATAAIGIAACQAPGLRIDFCGTTGKTRLCSTACGEGLQTCRSGAWQGCEVPLVARSCQGVCGAGTQECVDEQWKACVIPSTQLPCTNNCGEGTQLCENEKKGVCEVAPVVATCASICGAVAGPAQTMLGRV